ncbi:GAF domain-containing protein [Streptomyces sp. ISL-14]|nr:GAF domain-containing protein [Streptomyces sp. ISL-14]
MVLRALCPVEFEILKTYHFKESRMSMGTLYQTNEHERERINALQRYQILDTPPDGSFDRITALASQLLNVPIAITSLVDEDRIWFKSHHGLDVQEIDREPGLCASAILNNVPYILNDASIDPRSLANPLVAGEMGLRFYAGIPLVTHDNHNLGVLCVIDFEPREITKQEINILSKLAQVVMDEMELRLAARKIEKLSKEKSNLLAVLSHEIRTPLNGVIGMSSLLHSTELTQEQNEYVDVIETSSQSLLTMVNHILDYSKIESGKMKLNIQPFDIHFCIKKVMDLFSAEVEQKELCLTYEIDPKIPDILIADDHKIRQILVNLVGNAVKFTKEGEISTLINLVSSDYDADYATVSFTVKDTGIGIPNDQTHRLFQPFSQVQASASDEIRQGTGLGLSICKQLVELMNGRIWLEESTKSGSTFTFELRLPFEY